MESQISYVIGLFLTFNREIQNLGFVVAVAIFSGALLIYFFSLLTHRHTKRYLSRSQFSSINYKQQQRLTWLLVGQGSMPLLLVFAICLILLIGLPDLLEKKPISKNLWESCLAVISLYPLLGALLTILLTKPYYEALKLKLLCRQSRNKSDVTITKFWSFLVIAVCLIKILTHSTLNTIITLFLHSYKKWIWSKREYFKFMILD